MVQTFATAVTTDRSTGQNVNRVSGILLSLSSAESFVGEGQPMNRNESTGRIITARIRVNIERHDHE